MRRKGIFIGRLSTVQIVQEQFSLVFPFLKLIFFKVGQNKSKTANQLIMIGEQIQLKEINPVLEEGELEIMDSTTVAEIEQKISLQFGLSVQVLRRSGNLWLGTANTKSWTLNEQDEHGREISSGHGNQKAIVREIPARRNLG